jgi:hypothetical protein
MIADAVLLGLGWFIASTIIAHLVGRHLVGAGRPSGDHMVTADSAVVSASWPGRPYD